MERLIPQTSGADSELRFIDDDAELVDDYFERLGQAIYSRLNQLRDEDGSVATAPVVFFERGKIYPNRRYFFLKPKNEPGWLFERSLGGWLISRSEKIGAQDLFLREKEAWDHVSLYVKPGSIQPLIKLKSTLASSLLSYRIYEKLMLDRIGAS